MELTYREAAVTDVLALVKLFADDPLGAQREDVSEPINPAYLSAFASISADPNNELMVIESSGRLVGTLQLTYLPNLTRLGSWRCQIEGVRIHRDFRGQVDRAEKRGCHLVQLTSDKQRPEALKFYENLGFQATHEGFKLKIND
jgi:GNAT superfamily N-acetyltransferase